MKKQFQSLSASLVVAFIFSVSMSSLFVNEARGEFAGFKFGTNAVTEYCLENSKDLISVSIYKETGESQPILIGQCKEEDLSFSDKNELDLLFQNCLSSAVKQVLTNDIVDKDGPLRIFAYTAKYDALYHRDFNCFIVSNLVSLVKTNGDYQLPDLSGVKMELNKLIPIEVPQLKWARIETYSATNLAEPFEIIDPRYELDMTKTGIYTNINRIDFKRDYICSGNKGPFRIKIMIVSGQDNDYQIFDSTGAQIPETPMVLDKLQLLVSQDTNDFQPPKQLAFSTSGGDPGRIFRFQGSENPDGPWLDMGTQLVIPSYGSPRKTYYMAIWNRYGEKGFIRFRTVPRPPF